MREELRRCRQILKEIITLEERAEAIRASIEKARAIQYAPDMIRSSPEGVLENRLIDVMEIEATVDLRYGMIRDTRHMIEGLEDPRHRQLLMLYYLIPREFNRGEYTIKRLHTWHSVADAMGYSVQHTRRLHYQALDRL